MLKKFPSDKINVKKNALLSFVSSIHNSFTFNLQFFYELKQMAHLSKNISQIFHFRVGLVFIKGATKL